MNTGGYEGEQRAPLRERRHRLISPITRRILTVNLVALGTLVAGLLYLGEYRRSLIANELNSLDAQAQMFAAALGEGAVISDTPNGQFLVSDVAHQITRRLVEITDTRARLFRSDGVLIVDSRRLGAAGGTVQIETLPPPDDGMDLLETILDLYDNLARKLHGEKPLPRYRENALQAAQDFPEDDWLAARR